MLNGISVLSIYVYDFFLQPLAQEQPPQKWLHRSVGWFYHVLWLLPVVGASLYLNVRTRILNPLFSGVRHLFLQRACVFRDMSSVQASWCALIAKRAFTLRHGLAFPYAGMTSTTSPNAYIAFLNSLATSAYRAVMIATCIFLSFALGYVPGIGGVAETIFFCWVNA
jgi:etoposide-induced 2.4 mRNA